MRRFLPIFLPPLVLGIMLSLIYLLPEHKDLVPSAISPNLPLGHEVVGWYGIKQQESELERTMLAGDTIFSKAVYAHMDPLADKKLPSLQVSIVYSGSDMNSSIHRPERCLPSQGHLDIKTTTSDITLADGHTITFNKLTSRTPVPEQPGVYRQHINYYVFIGCSCIRTTHWDRTLRDMRDRFLLGIAQRWAYYQIGSFWGGDTDSTEQEVDSMLRDFISTITPNLVDWEKIDN